MLSYCCAGLQCLAGYGTDEPQCTSLVVAADPGRLNAVRHWQSKHRNIRLSQLLFLDTASQEFLELSHIYNTAAVCAAAGDCNAVAYLQLEEATRGGGKLNSQQRTAVEEFFAAHAQRAHHGQQLAASLFRQVACSEFIASSHSKAAAEGNNSPTDEEIVVDAKLTKVSKKSFKADKTKKKGPERTRRASSHSDTTVVVASTANAASPPLDSSVRGYKCAAVDSCHKLFMVSSIQGPSVAISRLKSHFNIKHQDLGSESFAFEAIYTPELAASAADENDLSAVATPPRKSPARATAVAAAAKSPAPMPSPGENELSRHSITQFISIL
jgi:hypothetical protein